MTLQEYVLNHTERGECKCGQCIDVGSTPDPTHSVDMIFMVVAATNNPSIDEFKTVTAGQRGMYGNINPLDGKEHSYIELGAWIGDQGLALQYMALGVSLGVFNLLSGKTILKLNQPEALALAQRGLLAIQAKNA